MIFKEVLSLIERAENQINKYKKPAVNQIRITPSNLHQTLGKKAIPVYYDIDDNFLKAWDFDKTQNLQYKYNLSYHTEKLSQEDYVQQSLKYINHSYEFFAN